MTATKQNARGAVVREQLVALERSQLRVFGVAVVCTYLAFVPIVFDPVADFAFTIPKALLGHALTYILGAVLAALFIRHRTVLVPWSFVHVPVIGFLFVCALATVTAVDPYVALFGEHGRMLGLGTFASWTLLYFGVASLVRTRNDLLALGASVLVGAAAILGYEAIQLLRLDPVKWNTDTSIRPIGTNGQATTLASYLCVLGMGVITVVATAPMRKRWQLLLSGYAVIVLAGAAATATRSIVFGLAAGGVALVVLVVLRTASRVTRLAIAGAGVAAALVFAVILAFTPVGGRLFQSVDDPNATVSARLDLASLDVRAVLYQVALDAVRERPVLGYGPDNFIVAMTRHRPETGPEEARLSYATSAHGWIGQVAVDAGVVGLIAFVAIAGAAALLALRNVRRPVACVGVVVIATFLGTGLTTVSDAASDWVFWVGAALVATASSPALAQPAAAAPVGRGRTRRGVQRRSRDLLGLLLVSASLVLAATTVPAFQASRAAKISENARLLNEPGAIEAAASATRSDPGRADYWHVLGLAYVGAGRWRDAASALQHAVDLAPWDSRSVSDLIQTQLALANSGDTTARSRLRRLADDVVRVDPNYPDAQATRATVMQFLGDYPQALAAIQRALALAPNTQNENWYVTASELYLTLARPTDAVAVALRGLTILDRSIPLRLQYARALLADGNPDAALQQISVVLAADPTNQDALRLKAQIQAPR